MSTRPASPPPEWATDGGAQITEPALGVKQEGNVGGDPLFSDYENWFKNLVFQWLTHFAEGSWTDDIDLTGTFTASGVITPNGGITVPSGQHIDLVNALSFVKHAERQLDIVPYIGTGLAVDADGNIEINSASDVAWYNIPIFAQKTVAEIEITCTDAVSDPLFIELYSKTGSGLTTLNTGGTINTDGGGGLQTITLNVAGEGVPFQLAFDTAYRMSIQGSGSGTCKVHRVQLTYTHP